MSESLAVLADIHGVLPALNAVLAEPAVQAADRIVICGDISAGPQPIEVLDRLLGLGDRVVLVRGNADRELSALVESTGVDTPDPIAPWAASRLRARPDLVAVLRDLPHPLTLDVGGFGPVLFCHGTPRADDEVVLVDTRPGRWRDALAAVADEVRLIVCGHTHMPFVRLVDRRTVLNPGSIGMPYGGTGAQWALLSEGGSTLCTTRYDVAAARAAIRATCDYPDIDAWTDEYLYARNSDLDALAAFGPRDGRPVSWDE